MQRHSWRISHLSGKVPGPSPARSCRFAGRVRAAGLLHVLFVAAIAAVALWRPPGVEEQIEGRLLDWRFRARNAWVLFKTGNAYSPPAMPRIVTVAIDQASIDAYDGGWALPPARIAELIKKIAEGKPRAMGIGLALRDPMTPSEITSIATALASVQGKVAMGVNVVVGAPFTGSVPPELDANAITGVEDPSRLLPLEAAQARLPPGPIAEAAVLGCVSPGASGGFKVRRESLYLRYGSSLVPSLAFQTARLAAGLRAGDVRLRGDGGIEFGEATVPADRRGRLLLKYYGGRESFRPYSAGSVLRGDTSPDVFEDAVVFVAASLLGTVEKDPSVDTPVDDNLPAVEKDATVAANILAPDFLREASPAATVFVVIAAGLAVPLLVRRRAAFSLLWLLGLTLALMGGNFALFLRGHLVPLAYPLFLLLAAGGGAVLHQHLREVRVARRMRLLFSSYVTERVLDRLIADPAMARPGGERREVTIIFTDIRAFMAFSEKHPPEEVVRTLNEYLEAMTEVVFRWEGTLDKFIGDSILAFWGAPLPQEDHAERALRCALHMCARLDSLNAAWAAAGRQSLEIGIGVTTGQVLVGNVGAEGKKMDYTVIGDQVNLCSRVEELTKEFHARILITASTFARLRSLLAAGKLGHVSVEGLAAVAVKGKEEPVRLYRVSPLGHGERNRVEDSVAAAPGP